MTSLPTLQLVYEVQNSFSGHGMFCSMSPTAVWDPRPGWKLWQKNRWSTPTTPAPRSGTSWSVLPTAWDSIFCSFKPSSLHLQFDHQQLFETVPNLDFSKLSVCSTQIGIVWDRLGHQPRSQGIDDGLDQRAQGHHEAQDTTQFRHADLAKKDVASFLWCLGGFPDTNI